MLAVPQTKYNFREIPEELRSLNQWMPWKKIVRNDEATKSPCDLYGKPAARTDERNWMSYEDALSSYRDGYTDGVGFCFTPDLEYVFIDADKCLSHRDIGEHQNMITGFGSFAEYSQSGTGYHIIVKGHKPGKKTKRHKNGVGYEIYDNWFCCFTGDRIAEAKATIGSNQTAIDEFYKWLFGEDQKENNVVGIQEVGEIDDEQVVQKILESKQGDVFLGLMKGDISAGATDDHSHSAALMRLCNILAFWTKDWMQIDRIVRQSGLYYEKWDRISEVTIEKALSLVTDGYSWNQENSENEITPMPLPKRATALPFPTEVFPLAVQTMVRAVAKSLGLPDDFIAVHVLNIAGAAIGKSRLIEIKQGYRQYPNLYTALIGETGTGKSPSLDKAFEPIGHLQKEAHETYVMEMEEYETRLAEYEALSKHQKEKEERVEPVKPTMREYYTSQATTEAIFKMLKFNPRGIVVKLDELSSLVKGMNQYKGGRGDDREHFLSCWANADAKINRVREDEPAILHKPFLSVTGNLPPDILPKMETQGEEDGFIDRFLFAYPDDQKVSAWSWDGVDPIVMQKYEMVFYRLYSLSDKESKVLGLSDEAKRLFERWHNGHVQEMQQEDFNPRLRGPYAKMTNQLARLALIVQVMNAVCGHGSDDLISGDSLAAAIQLVDYFKRSARKVYQELGTTKGDKRCIQAVEWIRDRGGVATKKEAQHGKLVGCKKASEVQALFEELEDLGYGTVKTIRPSGRGKHSIAFQLF